MITKLKNVPEVRGELMERVLLNAARLCSPIYRPHAIYTQDKNGWPGDWEGRTVLALVSHMKCLGHVPAYLDQILQCLPEHYNEKGYLGRILEEGLFDEQQFSGHNWLIRGLMEYYVLTGNEEIALSVKRIVYNLYLPAAGAYKNYPLKRGTGKDEGSYSGSFSGRSGSWLLSTDIGCAFMCLDGLSQYYSLFKDEKVFDLLREMTDVFVRIDFEGLKMQTHATLSALRGIIRLYQSTGEEPYLSAAKEIMRIYERSGMTENYANFNWFGRFDTWTEPCAITDSMMAATELFKITGDVSYLKLAQRIYFNAFSYAQRYNGGFGTDSTVGPAGKYLRPSGGGISEAYWCCTMRGAEGLAYLCENSVLTDVDGNLLIPFGGSFRCENELFSVDFESGIPYNGKYTVSAHAFSDVSIRISVFKTDDFETVYFDLKKGETGTVSGAFDPGLHEEGALETEGKKFFYGNLLLGTPNGAVEPLRIDMELGNGLQPLTNMKDVLPENTVFENRQIVF